jgi:hypothetical protein
VNIAVEEQSMPRTSTSARKYSLNRTSHRLFGAFHERGLFEPSDAPSPRRSARLIARAAAPLGPQSDNHFSGRARNGIESDRAPRERADSLFAFPTAGHIPFTFLNSLPTQSSGLAWTRELRDTLLSVLPGVDRITLAIDLACRLFGGDRPVRNLVAAAGDDASGDLRCTVVRSSPGDSLAGMARADRDFFERFHPPVVFDYFFPGGSYLGSMILWSERRHSPVPASTIAMVTALKPFLLFLLSDGIARTKLQGACADGAVASATGSMLGRASL